jgi:hypothetical protein
MKRKIYAPVTEFERATSYCPLYLAWQIVDEARDYFRTPIPEAFADQLARRAEAVFAHQPFWARKASPRARTLKSSPRAGSRKVAAHAGTQQQFECRRQREYILMSMRHWLAGVLARERPALFRALPESFKVGLELPQKRPGGAAAPPYQKQKTVGLTCRSAAVSHGSRGRSPHQPTARFVHGCELIPV